MTAHYTDMASLQKDNGIFSAKNNMTRGQNTSDVCLFPVTIKSIPLQTVFGSHTFIQYHLQSL